MAAWRASLGNALSSGLGANLEGDMFYCDQQGTDACYSHPSFALRSFLRNPSGLASQNLDTAIAKVISDIPDRKIPYPEALATIPELRPRGLAPLQQSSGLSYGHTGHRPKRRFGPFDGRLLIGELPMWSQPGLSRESQRGLSGCLLSISRQFPSAVFV